jgi:hypothetical protein
VLLVLFATREALDGISREEDLVHFKGSIDNGPSQAIQSLVRFKELAFGGVWELVAHVCVSGGGTRGFPMKCGM